MPDPLLYVAAQGTATVAGAVFVLAIGWFWKPVSTARFQAAAVVGIAGGLGAGYYFLRLHVAWPPLNGLDRFLIIVLPAALCIELGTTFSRVPRSLAWLMRFTLAATMGRILVHDSVYVSGAEPEWSPMQAVVVLFTCSALIAVVWGLLVFLSVRSPASVSIPLALALTIQCTGISIMLAGYLQGGAAAFPLSAATVGTIGSLRLLTSSPNVHAPIGVCVVGLGSLLMIGRFFGGLSTEVALILLLAPLLCWGTELPQLRCRPGWVVGLLRLLLVAIPLAALLLQAKRKFDRETAPLLMQASESQCDGEMHRRGGQGLAAGSMPPILHDCTPRSLNNMSLNGRKKGAAMYPNCCRPRWFCQRQQVANRVTHNPFPRYGLLIQIPSASISTLRFRDTSSAIMVSNLS